MTRFFYQDYIANKEREKTDQYNWAVVDLKLPEQVVKQIKTNRNIFKSWKITDQTSDWVV